jgi:hypothetical protein
MSLSRKMKRRERNDAAILAVNLLIVAAKGPHPDWNEVLSADQKAAQVFARDTLDVAGIDWRVSTVIPSEESLRP